MYRRGKSSWLKHLDFLIVDAVCLEAALVVSYMLYYREFLWPFADEGYGQLGLILLILHVCVALFLESYKNVVKRGYMTEANMVVQHSAVLLLVLFAYLFASKQGAEYSRVIVFLLWPCGCALMLFGRLAWKRVVRRRIRANRKKRTVLVIVNPENADHVVSLLRSEYYPDFTITGAAVVDREPEEEGKQEAIRAEQPSSIEQSSPIKEIRGISVVADRGTLLQYVKQNVVDEVLIDLPGEETYVASMINHLIGMGVTVHINIFQVESQIENRIVEHFGRCTVMTLGGRFANDWQLMMKRFMDICGSLVGLVITGVLFVIFAPIIYIQSPGPIFFAQDRVGRNGRIFRLYKFRSMCVDAEEKKKDLMDQNKMKGLMFKMDDDPRVIPIGRFMRKTSLDEFPQFWNVLRGDMSLVGTRPPTVEEYQAYDLHHKRRLAAKPGITGLWQISGRSDIVDFEEVVALDAKYISDWNLRLDIKILCKTVVVLLTRKGAV